MERIEIIGNLTADPEMRTTQSGSTVCSFTVAVNQPQTKAQRDSGQRTAASGKVLPGKRLGNAGR